MTVKSANKALTVGVGRLVGGFPKNEGGGVGWQQNDGGL